MTYRIGRWCWRLLPEKMRHELYRKSERFAYRAMRPIARVVRRITFGNQRDAARMYWPDIHGLDLHLTTVLLPGLRVHGFLLARFWANAHHVRRFCRRRATSGDTLNILHVTSSFDLGGTQRQIINLCTSRAARLRHDTIEIFPELNFLYRRDVPVDPDRYVTGGPLRRMLGRLVLNISTRSPQLVQVYKLFVDFKAAAPDVVVGWGHEMCATTFLAASLARVPHIVFCIRTFNPAFGWTDARTGRLLRVAHRRMTPYVSAVITNSTPLREDHSRWLGISPDKISVSANGIDAPPLTTAEIAELRAHTRAELGIGDGTFVAINVGRFSKEKGQDSIVSVNERLARDYGDRLLWLLCGDGPTLETVQARTRALGMTNIRFLGRTTAVYDYLCASDLFVMPSDFEGMPNAMMEAMACGLPALSTARSGAIDVARHGEEALFYPNGDLDAMERAVRRLLDHPDEARAMGLRAKARLRDFSIDRSVASFEAILERATNTTSVPPGAGIRANR
jgi:glycosyltransferase involved in cell wall biosynthesis